MTDFPEQLLGIDEVKKTSPETRLTKASVARSIVNRAIQDDQPRSRQRAIVSGMVHGNPPYRSRPKELSWTANINFMEAKAAIRTAHTPYVQIGNGVEFFADCRTAHLSDDPNHEQWNRSISQRFHNMLDRWKQRQWHTQFSEKQMLMHGIGPCFFDKKGDWRFRALPSAAVKVPKNAPSCLDERIPWVVVLTPYTVLQLWEKIRGGDDAATKAGWNVQLIKDTIRKYGKGIVGNVRSDWTQISWERYEQELKTNDFSAHSSNCEIIPCAHVLYQEYSGKISTVIVTEAELTDGNTALKKSLNTDEFLFQDIGKFDNYEQALVTFFLDIDEDGLWHSVRGLAEDGFRHWEVLNRLYNRALDGAFIESSLVLKPGTSKNADKMSVIQLGPLTILPPGAEVAQTKLSGFLEGPMNLARFVSNNLANNLGMYQQRAMGREDGRGETRTAEEIRAQVSSSASLGQGQMILLFQTKDKIFAEQFRRASDPNTSDDEATRFQRECEEDGVPKEALQKMEYVRANRASGYGSPQMRQLTDQQMMPYLAMLPEQGKQNFLEDAVGAIKGADKVRRYLPLQVTPTNDDWMAAMENAAVHEGVNPPIISGQDDVIHIQSHLKDATDTLEPVDQAIQQGQNDPAQLQQAYQYLQIMGPHIEAHLARISKHVGNIPNDASRAGLAEMFKVQIAQLVSFSGKLRGAIHQAQNEVRLQQMQQSQATALGALDQARLQSAQVEDHIKIGKFDTDTRIKTMKAAAQARLSAVKTAEQIRQSRAKELAGA